MYLKKITKKYLNNDKNWEVVKNEDVNENCYLKHKDGHIITCNSKAWMTIEIMEVYIKTMCPLMGKDAHLVMDNFSAHTNDQIRNEFKKNGVQTLFLHPNTTSITQPLDVAVNFQLKAALTNNFCSKTFEHFQSYFEKAQNTLVVNNSIHAYEPPNLSVFETMLDVISTIETNFTHEKFKSGVKRAFESIGLVASTMQPSMIPRNNAQDLRLGEITFDMNVFPIEENEAVQEVYGLEAEEEEEDDEE